MTGAGGFIASHLAKRLKSEGHYLVCADWKRNSFMPVRLDPSTLVFYSRDRTARGWTAVHCQKSILTPSARGCVQRKPGSLGLSQTEACCRFSFRGRGASD